MVGGMFPPRARCARRPWVDATAFLLFSYAAGGHGNCQGAGRWGGAGALSAMDGAKRGPHGCGSCRPPQSPTARPQARNPLFAAARREGVSPVRPPERRAKKKPLANQRLLQNSVKKEVITSWLLQQRPWPARRCLRQPWQRRQRRQQQRRWQRQQPDQQRRPKRQQRWRRCQQPAEQRQRSASQQQQPGQQRPALRWQLRWPKRRRPGQLPASSRQPGPGPGT